MSTYGLILLAISSLVQGHGYVKSFTVDGTLYPGWSPADRGSTSVKRIEWGFPAQNTASVGPVLDVTSPDIACRKGATAPALIAPIRAGGEIKFQWTNYFTSHKGPVLTYMGRMDSPNMKPQDVKFFKIDQGTYDPKTGIWGSDVLIKNNNQWNVQIPSDIKPGKYIVRHELIALHFGGSGNPNGAGTASSGAQLYPICINVEVIGSGTKEPEGVKFPGGYTPKDAGILDNIYVGVNRYIAPGPAVYEGEHKAPTGPKPAVKETGKGTGASEIAVAAFDALFHSIVSGVNEVLPGGGGYKSAADGNPALAQPVNGGKSTAPVGNLLRGGLLPTGVYPVVGNTGNNGVTTAPKAPAPKAPTLRIKGRAVY